MRSSCGAIPESVVFVEDDEGGDDAGHPSAGRQEQNDEDAAATAVQNSKGRKQDGEQDLQQGHARKIGRVNATEVIVLGHSVCLDSIARSGTSHVIAATLTGCAMTTATSWKTRSAPVSVASVLSPTRRTQSSEASSDLYVESEYEPKAAPYIPEGLVWYGAQLDWQRLAADRLEAGLKSTRFVLKTSRREYFSQSEEKSVQKELSAVYSGVKGPMWQGSQLPKIRKKRRSKTRPLRSTSRLLSNPALW